VMLANFTAACSNAVHMNGGAIITCAMRPVLHFLFALGSGASVPVSGDWDHCVTELFKENSRTYECSVCE
jgi:hypothetical protein